MIVLDTNVVSEFMRVAPDRQVLAWAEGIATGGLVMTAVTVQEIEYGLGRMPVGRRRNGLVDQWERLLEMFGDAVLAFDLEAAHATARIVVDAQGRGRPITHADAQIAGTCVAHGASLATRNVADFAGVAGLRVVNPFDALTDR